MEMNTYLIQALNLVLFLLLMGGIPALLLCRRRYPDRLWLGVTFCALLGALGHFYIKNGFVYVFATSLITFLLFRFTENVIILLCASAFFSVGFMVLRFRVNSISAIEQGR